MNHHYSHGYIIINIQAKNLIESLKKFTSMRGYPFSDNLVIINAYRSYK